MRVCVRVCVCVCMYVCVCVCDSVQVRVCDCDNLSLDPKSNMVSYAVGIEKLLNKDISHDPSERLVCTQVLFY